MSKKEFVRVLCLLAGVAAVGGGCSDATTPTEPPSVLNPPPTPTPVPPAVNVSGAWTGTFSVDNIEFCTASGIPAQATFQQDGANVTGTLNAPTAPCFALANRPFTGTLHGNTLIGFAAGTFGSIQGTATDSTLEIGLGFGAWPSEGSLHLHR